MISAGRFLLGGETIPIEESVTGAWHIFLCLGAADIAPAFVMSPSLVGSILVLRLTHAAAERGLARRSRGTEARFELGGVLCCV